jgi:hypothetical protein
MILDETRKRVLGSMGWIDHGAIWCCDLESRAETLIPVPGAQFVGVRGGRDGFFRVTHGESAGVVASVRHVSRPEEILSSVLLDATGPVLDGDMDVWRMVDRACVVKGLTGQKVLLVEYLLGEVKDIDLGWYNAETYDLGYQGLVDCLAVSGGKEVVVSVQRSSKLVIVDVATNLPVGSIVLAGSGGNPGMSMISGSTFLASDYDTLCLVDASARRTTQKVRLQDGGDGFQRRFVGEYQAQIDGLCIVARPYSNDVALLDSELNVIGQAPVKCQPMQVCMTSSREFLVRDWQSGIPEFGEFSGKL